MIHTFFNGLDVLYHRATFGEDRTTRASRRCENVVFVTGRMPRSGKLPVLNLFIIGQKSGFFSPRRDDSLHRFTSNLAGLTGMWVRLAVQSFTSIATGGGVENAAPKNIKNFHFLVKSRPAEATHLTDF